MKTIRLKKYKNRKLFAVKGEIGDKGTYVNHKEVADFIRQGYTIKVTKKEDNTDVTDAVLGKVLESTGTLSTAKMLELIRG